MEPATRRRSIGEFARFVARRPRRSAAVALIGLVAGAWVWWSAQLWGLPDVGDPFDVAAFEAQRIPDDRNAYHWYRDASSMNSATMSKFLASETASDLDDFPAGWAVATPTWRDLLARSGEALAAWRAGSEKPDARYDHPEGISIRTLLPVAQGLRMLGGLAVLEGSRLEAAGDMVGAWGWYRSALRSSRHAGKHGFEVERLFGIAMHDQASKALTRWASDPRVDAALLRRALAEVIAIDAMTVPPSEAVKMGYLTLVHELADPAMVYDLLVSRDMQAPAGWCNDLPVSDGVKVSIQATRVLATNDREKCLRVVRLMTANRLAQVDRPPGRRSKLAHRDPPIYGPDPDAPAALDPVPPEALARWVASSLLASRIYSFPTRLTDEVDRERASQARLVVHLADQLHRRERGGPPPSPEALVGPYLEALPEGHDAVPEPGAKP